MQKQFVLYRFFKHLDKLHFKKLAGLLSKNTHLQLLVLLLFSCSLVYAQGPNPQTGMRVTGLIKLSSSCESDTLKMENLTKDSAKTVKFYVHNYNYFNDPIYPQYKDTIYTKAQGFHVYHFKDSLVLAKCLRSVNLYFGIIAYDTFGIDYPVISRITIFLRPRAIFKTDSVICAGEQLNFTNISCKDSTRFKWYYNDTVSNAQTPAGVKFNKSGIQKIKLVANTFSPCVQSDTLTQSVNVLKVPEPGFNITTPSFALFKDSVICVGDTLLLLNTSKNNDSITYDFSPPGLVSLAGNSRLYDDTVKLIMLSKGKVSIEQIAFNRACNRISPKRNLILINNPIIRIKPLPKCLDSNWINLDQYVDTSNGVPRQVVWKIKGKGIDKTLNTLYPGMLKSLSYGQYQISVISIGACKTIINTDSFFMAPPVLSSVAFGICYGADSVVKLNKFFKLPSGFKIRWSGPVSNDSLFRSKGKPPGKYILTLNDQNSSCYQPTVNIDMIGGSVKPPDQHLCMRTEAILPLDTLINGSFSGPGVSNDTFYSMVQGPGSFKVQYTSSVKSCIFKDSLIINVYDTFTPQFSFKDPACKDSSVVFKNNTSEKTVMWIFGDGLYAATDQVSHRYQQPGKYKVQLLARTYCTDTLSKTITIYPSPSAGLRIRQDTLGCDSSVIYASFVNKGYGENYSVIYGNKTFYGDSIRFAIAKSFQPQFVSVSGIATSNCGNSQSLIKIRIPQRNFAAIEILGLNPGCHGDSLKLVNLSYGQIDSFRVDYGNGITSKNKILKLPYFNNSSNIKQFDIILKAYNQYCGVLRDTAHYKVIPNVIRAAGEHNKKTLCNYDMVTFINNSTPGTDYYLYFGDGGSSAGREFHQSVNYQYLTPGVYIPYIKAASACGSDSVVMDTIRVNGAPKVEFSNPRSKMCLGSEIYIKYTPSNLLHPKWIVNYQLVDSLVNPFVFHPESTGTYKIGVIVSNQFCVGLDSFEVTVESAPNIQIEMDEVTCDTMRVEIHGNYHLGKLEVNWGDGITDFAKLYHVYMDTGRYFVKIMLIEGLCTLYFEREIMVKMPPRFRISAHPRLTECLNPGDTLNMAILLDSLAYQVDMFNWTGAPICLNCERTIRDIPYSICEPKTFKIIVRDKDQCRTEQQVNYACFDPGGNKYKAFIPNAFTPKNGDLMNDVYMPVLPHYEPGMMYDLKIFNRWGELVFHTTDPSVGWDGSYKGNICEMDVYVYLIEYGCENPDFHYNKHRGTFHLLR